MHGLYVLKEVLILRGIPSDPFSDEAGYVPLSESSPTHRQAILISFQNRCALRLADSTWRILVQLRDSLRMYKYYTILVDNWRYLVL